MSVPYAEVIGDPIAHSKSPLIHKFWLDKLGLPYDFHQTQVHSNQLPDFLRARRIDPQWCGCSVTIPHKQTVIEHLNEVNAAATELGAVNCITRLGAKDSRLIGHNTDWSGFLEPLQPWLEREHVLRLAYVIGTGGAAAAVSYALNRAAFTIVSVGRNEDKVDALRKRLDLFDDDLVVDLAAMRGDGEGNWGDRTSVLDLLVNATPLGMSGFPPLEINLRQQPPNSLIYDLVYDPLETALLRQAHELGMTAIDGLGMLVAQAAIAFELFFMEPAPRQHDVELRELLLQ